MGKSRYNAKARQVVKTNIDNSQTNEVICSLILIYVYFMKLSIVGRQSEILVFFSYSTNANALYSHPCIRRTNFLQYFVCIT